MSKIFKITLCLLLMNFISCSSDDNSEFSSFGIMEADFDGKRISLNVDKAKEYPGVQGYMTIFGRNCSEGRIILRIDVPKDELGEFTLEELYVSHSKDAAAACIDTYGGNPPTIIDEAYVSVTKITDSHITGTFNIIGMDGVTPILIENGVFNVEIE